MAGFFYYLAMITASSRIYGINAPGDVYISMLCHGAVYLCGFVTIGTEKCDSKNAPLLILGVLLVAVRAALLRPFVAEQRLLICIPLNGAYLKSAFERKRRSWRNDRVLRRGFAAHSDFHSSLFPKEPRPPSEIRFAAHRMRLPYAPVIRIASIGTAKIAESATRLSTVGSDSPCCHL